MVFKGRFFSSKKSDPSSPDGSSNSPRSLGSNSPSRSEKKKVKSTAKEAQIASSSGGGSGRGFGTSAVRRQTQVKDGAKKDVKGKESQTQADSRLTSLKPSSGVGLGLSSLPSAGSKSKKATATAADGKESPSSVSPILASSLGLNRIKTRSGPLPQESFFGFRSDKGSTLGASNLSRLGGNGSSGSGSGGKKKELVNQSRVGFQESLGSGTLVDNGSNSDSMSTGSAPSRDQSPNVLARLRLQSGESSSQAGVHLP